jgi:hypothetical protein
MSDAARTVATTASDVLTAGDVTPRVVMCAQAASSNPWLD